MKKQGRLVPVVTAFFALAIAMSCAGTQDHQPTAPQIPAVEAGAVEGQVQAKDGEYPTPVSTNWPPGSGGSGGYPAPVPTSWPPAPPSPSPSPSPTPVPSPTPTPSSFTTTFSNSTPVAVGAGATSLTSGPIAVSGVPGTSIDYVIVSLYLSITDDSRVRYINLNFPDTASPGGTGFAAVYDSTGSPVGLSGTDLGTSCSATTTFDPRGSSSIISGTAPYVGVFRAYRGSADLDNVWGPTVNQNSGTWTLTLSGGGGDLGGAVLNCWRVDVVSVP